MTIHGTLRFRVYKVCFIGENILENVVPTTAILR